VNWTFHPRDPRFPHENPETRSGRYAIIHFDSSHSDRHYSLLFDLAAHHGWNIGGAILAKMEVNRGRPFMHGGKKF